MYYDKNIEMLKKSQTFYGLAQYLEEVTNNEPQYKEQFELLKKNTPVTYQENGVLFHSRRNPEREAEKQITAFLANNTFHLILIGAGLGYLTCAAYENENIESVMSLETNAFLIYCFLHLFAIKSNDKLSIVYVHSVLEYNLDSLYDFMRSKSAEEITIFAHPAARRARPEIYEQLYKRVRRVIEKRSINQATLIKFQDLWGKNIIANANQILKGGSLRQFHNAFEGKSIVIAGAGPSLSHSFADLKKFRNSFILLAADTAFLPLIRHEVQPDIVFATDPQWHNRSFVLNSKASRSSWLLDPVVCSACAHYLDAVGAKMIWWDNPFIYYEILKTQGTRGEISHGGSVSTNAFDFAIKSGCKEIVLVGQDLSFSDKLAHVKGAALEDAVFSRNHRFENMELHNYRQLTALPKIEVAAKNSEKVVGTNAKMKIFLEWFEEQALYLQERNSKIMLYNASYAGANIVGFKNDIFKNIFSQEYKAGLLKQHDESKKELSELFGKLENWQAEVRALKKIYQKSINVSKKLISSKDNGSIKKLNSQLALLDAEAKIQEQGNRLISLRTQDVILQISEHAREENAAQVSFMLYSRLVKECKIVLLHLGRLRVILSSD